MVCWKWKYCLKVNSWKDTLAYTSHIYPHEKKRLGKHSLKIKYITFSIPCSTHIGSEHTQTIRLCSFFTQWKYSGVSQLALVTYDQSSYGQLPLVTLNTLINKSFVWTQCGVSKRHVVSESTERKYISHIPDSKWNVILLVHMYIDWYHLYEIT